VGTDVVTELVRGVPVRCYRDRPGSVVEVLQHGLQRWPDAPLLVDTATGLTTTYAGFSRVVEGALAALRQRGLRPGDRVAWRARNGLEAAVAIWACARAGLVAVGLPVDAPDARLRSLLDLVEPALVLAQEGLPVPGGAESTDLLLADERDWDAERPLPDEDETYVLIATSGTTGRPKAVRVTGRMTGHAAVAYAELMALGPQDRTAIHLPFAWVSGHVTQLTPVMHSGGSAVTMPSFSAARLVDVVEEHGVTWLDVVPSIWESLLRTPGFGPERAGTVRAAVFGGAPAPPGTLDRVRGRLPQMALYDVYAQSETCAPVTVLDDGDMRERPGSVGRAVPYVELRVVAPDGTEVPAGQPGELHVRSAVTTPGYWGVEDPPTTHDGWLRTGDLARVDAEGFVTISGRAVDLVIRGGVNVYPAEVERALLATGALADAVVVGLPSPVLGQAVAAAVVAAPGAEPDRAALRTAVREALGVHAVPRPLRVVDALPRNAHGKVDRRAVAALLLADGPGADAAGGGVSDGAGPGGAGGSRPAR
jgi:long-chain acyl-CoA synthetase